MTVPYIFANVTTSIPLSELDSNFATPIVLGNTSIYLGNTTTSIGNLTLTNVTISSGSVNATSFSSANVSITGGSINSTPIGNTTPSTGAFTTLTASTSVLSPIVGAGTGSSLSLWSNGVTHATLDTNGNLGLGVTPSTWSTSFNQKAIQISTVGSLSSLSTGTGNQQVNLANNAYDFAAGPFYLTSDYATAYRQLVGLHAWYTAPSGTAGNPISFTQAMTLNNSGNLLVGTTVDNGTDKLQVNGSVLATEVVSYKWAPFTLGAGQYAPIIYIPAGGYGSPISGTLTVRSTYSGAVSGATYRFYAMGDGYGTGCVILDYGDYTTPANFSLYDMGPVLGGGSRQFALYNASGQSVTVYLQFTGDAGNVASYYATPTPVTGTPSGYLVTYGDFTNPGRFQNLTVSGVTPSAWQSGTPTLEFGGSVQGTIAFNGNNANGGAIWYNAYFNGTNDYYVNNGTAVVSTIGGPNAFAVNIAPSGTAGNPISFTQAMTLDNSGNLLVGTTSSTNYNPGIVLSPGFNAQITIGHSSTSGSGQYYEAFYFNGTLIGGITQNGTTAVSYNTTSDQDLKIDLGIASQSRILDLKIHDYEWKSDGSKARGVFAQEAFKVIPEAVTVGSDEINDDGTKDKPWAVDYSKFVPDLIVEIQALRREIEILKGAK